VLLRVQCCLGGFLTRDILHRLHIGIETGAPTPAWFTASMRGINDTPLLLFAFAVAFFMAGCYVTMWYASRLTHASKVRIMYMYIRVDSFAVAFFLDTCMLSHSTPFWT